MFISRLKYVPPKIYIYLLKCLYILCISGATDCRFLWHYIQLLRRNTDRSSHSSPTQTLKFKGNVGTQDIILKMNTEPVTCKRFEDMCECVDTGVFFYCERQKNGRSLSALAGRHVGRIKVCHLSSDLRASCYYFIIFISNIQTSAARLLSLDMLSLCLIFSMMSFESGKNAASSVKALVALSTFTSLILCQRTELFVFPFNHTATIHE